VFLEQAHTATFRLWPFLPDSLSAVRTAIVIIFGFVNKRALSRREPEFLKDRSRPLILYLREVAAYIEASPKAGANDVEAAVILKSDILGRIIEENHVATCFLGNAFATLAKRLGC
jgi:hypothetical protein